VIEHCKRELTGYKIPKYVDSATACEDADRQDPAAGIARQIGLSSGGSRWNKAAILSSGRGASG